MKHAVNTSVVNVRRAEPGEWDVYVGRAAPRARDKRCLQRSVFGNPFVVGGRQGMVGVGSAEEACDLFEALMRQRIRSGGGAHGRCVNGRFADAERWTADDWLEELLKLQGKRLACWCHPDPCHGHVLVKLIEELG